MNRTRIKICGLTRKEDIRAAVLSGADALGFVFYPDSPRYVEPEQARGLMDEIPPFITTVGLFVNADPKRVTEVMRLTSLSLLQFHGEEDEAYCRQFGMPYIKAARVRPELDLLKFAASFPSSRGLLLDAYVDGYGGGGQAFDWCLVPQPFPTSMILSGGLHAANVGGAVRQLRPWAVDVSSGVEAAKGIKDAGKIQAFVAAVREADASNRIGD